MAENKFLVLVFFILSLGIIYSGAIKDNKVKKLQLCECCDLYLGCDRPCKDAIEFEKEPKPETDKKRSTNNSSEPFFRENKR